MASGEQPRHVDDLLIDTVDSTTIRRRPAKFALVATLTGVALALAGGTAALALSGVPRSALIALGSAVALGSVLLALVHSSPAAEANGTPILAGPPSLA